MSAFLDAVAENTKGLRDISVTGEEAFFSWSECDTCGSQLGGDRIEALAIVDEQPREPLELSICTDCAMYFANGDEPEDWRAK